jgi:hypothetical protein
MPQLGELGVAVLFHQPRDVVATAPTARFALDRQGRDAKVRERVGVVFQARFLAALRRPARVNGRRRSFLRLLEANGPQDHPNNDDEEAEPECFDDQLLEPLRSQSIPPPAGHVVAAESVRAWSLMAPAQAVRRRRLLPGPGAAPLCTSRK